MKRLTHVWRVMGVGGCLLFLVSGCETVQDYSLSYKVWESGEFNRWSEPLPNPRLALFEDPARTNLLVAYDAFSERHSTIKRQAYYLQPNQTLPPAARAPKLVSPAKAQGLNPIPVYDAGVLATNSPGPATRYAILSPSGREFTLYAPADPPEAFQLPVYSEGSGTIKRVALTPFAAVGDTAMVGLAASFVALIAACESGFYFTP
jgi:hypothetical protein